MLNAVIGAAGDRIHCDNFFREVVGDRQQIAEFPISDFVIGD